MTTIIGLQYEDSCFIVADSRTTDHTGKVFSHPEVEKISERGQYLIAGSGETLPCDVAQHIWEPPTPTVKDSKDLYHFMISKVMPSLRKCLSENGYNFDETVTPGDGPRFTFLIALHGELFDIDAELSISRSEDGVYGAGSGAPYAIGAIFGGADAFEAMEIASKLTAYTAQPYHSKEQFKHIK
jgi:hypothetical protein